MNRVLWIACLLLAPFVFAQQDGAGPAVGVVDGTVTDTHGTPLPGATVTLRLLSPTTNKPSPSASATPGADSATTDITDASGHFALRQVPVGTYLITASHDGFTLQADLKKECGPASSVHVTAEKSASGIKCTMAERAVISGRILDSKGDPIIGAEAVLLQWNVMFGRKLYPVNMTLTDKTGVFQFSVSGGRYYMVARYKRRTLSREAEPAVETDYQDTFYPGVADATAATEIEVAAGAEMPGITIRLASAPVHRVDGRIAGIAPGTAASDLRVSYTPWNDLMFPFGGTITAGAFVHQDGTFELPNVPSGDWALTVTFAAGPARELARQRVEVGKIDVDGVVIGVQPAEVKGIVRIEGLKDATPEAVQPMHVQLTPVVGSVPGIRTATVGDDGSFVVPDLGRQAYELLVYPLPEGGYLRSITYAGVERMNDILDLSNGEPVIPIVVAVSAKGGEVRGVVSGPDGKPAAGSTITLVDDTPERTVGRRVTSKENGTFDVTGLRPGKYRAYAWGGRLDDVPWMDPQVNQTYESRSARVDVTEGVPVEVSLRQIVLEQ